MTFDYANIAKKLKKDDVADVKAKVDKYAAEVKKELVDFYAPDKIDAEVEKVVLKNLNKVFKLSGLAYAKDQAEKGNLSVANVIVLGVSPAEDRNSYKKWLATEEWRRDPKGAVKAGKVREAISKAGNTYAIALDNEPTIETKDKDGNIIRKENPNYGKDIPDSLKVNIPMIIASLDGQAKEEFIMGSMSWDRDVVNKPDIGKKSTVYGRINNDRFAISKDAYEGDEIYQKAYDVAARVLPSTDLWMNLVDVEAVPVVEMVDGQRKNVYTKFATKGTVQKVSIDEKAGYDGGKYLKASVRIGDTDVINGINMSTTYENTVAYITENIQSNDEVIVVGCKKSFAKKEGDKFVLDPDGNRIMIPYYELWGIIKEFNNEQDAMLERLRAKGLI